MTASTSESSAAGRNQLTAGPESALAGVRVLDLTDLRGGYCGKMFAGLGASVTLVEPLDGVRSRHRAPVSQREGLDSLSFTFLYEATGKRSVAIDLEHPDGPGVLLRLAAAADILIEDRGPAYWNARNLGYEELSQANPRLVVTSMTPYGQMGPDSEREASDLLILARGGMLSLGGYSDGQPMRPPSNQAHVAGASFAAVASMMAFLAAERDGQGQYIDLSLQEAITMTLENAAHYWELEGTIRRSFGERQRQAGTGVIRCSDGYVFVLAGGIGGNRFWPNLVDWLTDEGVEDADRLAGEQWSDLSFIATEESKAIFSEVFGRFAAGKTKAELGERSQRWRVPLAPVNSPADVLDSPQLAHRAYFVDTPLPNGERSLFPGAPYQLSETPWLPSTEPAPAIGAHTETVLSSAGFDAEEIAQLRDQQVVR